MRRAPAILAIAALLGGCAAEPSNEGGEGEASALTATPTILVPANETVRTRCAEETSATYCSVDAAARAQRRCDEKLGHARYACSGDGCLTMMTPERADACRAGKTFPTAYTCTQPVVDDCSFYRSCLEDRRRCGEGGYPLHFGERLCFSFMREAERFSPEGRVWLRKIRACLETELVGEMTRADSCDDLEANAYESHVRCYTARGQSLCDLSLSDRVALLGVMGHDLFSVRALDQARKILASCF